MSREPRMKPRIKKLCLFNAHEYRPVHIDAIEDTVNAIIDFLDEQYEKECLGCQILPEDNPFHRHKEPVSERNALIDELIDDVEKKKGDDDAYPIWNDTLDDLVAVLKSKKK